MLRPAVDIARQLGAVVHAFVEAAEDGVLEAARGLSREGSLAETPRDRRNDLGHGQIRHEDIVPALHDLIELVAARLRQVELEQGARVAIEGAGQPSPVCGPALAKPRGSAPPRGDPRGPR
jgi:hypothetical protein